MAGSGDVACAKTAEPCTNKAVSASSPHLEARPQSSRRRAFSLFPESSRLRASFVPERAPSRRRSRIRALRPGSKTRACLWTQQGQPGDRASLPLGAEFTIESRIVKPRGSRILCLAAMVDDLHAYQARSRRNAAEAFAGSGAPSVHCSLWACLVLFPTTDRRPLRVILSSRFRARQPCGRTTPAGCGPLLRLRRDPALRWFRSSLCRRLADWAE